MTPRTQSLEVWGDLACFTQPPLKVERFSYPAITPSAARGIFEAIYWKPKFRWQITEIEILTVPQYIGLRRNEVKNKAPATDTILRWMRGNADPVPIIANGTEESEKGRTQRQTMALKDVRYRIHAEIRPWPAFHNELVGMEAQFRRHAAAGQCVYQPYLGCREFPAFFMLSEKGAVPRPVQIDMSLGWMLYDVFDLSRPGTSEQEASISIFDATVKRGVVHVPEFEDPAVRRVR